MSAPDDAEYPWHRGRLHPPTEDDRARIDLAAALRTLVSDAFVSTASAADVDAAAASVRAATEAVNRATGADIAAETSVYHDRSPFMGLMNPLSPPMTPRVVPGGGEWGTVEMTVTFGRPYEGPPGHVHGGFIAAAFDEVLGQAQSLPGNPGMTGKLSVSYRAPTPLFVPLTLRGWITRITGRKIHTHATLHHGETLCCEAEGLFISIPEERRHMVRKERDPNRPFPGG